MPAPDAGTSPGTARSPDALASDPSPAAPQPAASQRPLKEIGRIRVTSPQCKALVGNAVRAVQIETENNRRLTEAEATLGSVDLDSSELAKHRGVVAIGKEYVTLRAATVEGENAMHAFRLLAKTAPTDEQRASLISFEEALDGALHRQKVLAQDMGGLIAYLDSHPPIDADEHDEMIFNAIRDQNDGSIVRGPFDPRDFGPTAGVPDPLSVTAKSASEEIARRAKPIADDENTAASRIDIAFSGC